MISINRLSAPEFLTKRNDKFTENDYSHPTVRARLKEMQFYKCCYCERDLKELESEIEGEHFISRKSPSHKNANNETQWHLVNAWNNLLLSCRTCNLVKGAKPPFSNAGIRLIIDPSDPDIDPENEIKFDLDDDVLPLYDFKKSSTLGLSTIKKIGLDRNTFLRRKFRGISAEIVAIFNDLWTAIEDENSVSISDICGQISELTRANTPFAAFCRAVIKMRLTKLCDKDIPKLEEYHKKSFTCPDILLFTRHETER